MKTLILAAALAAASVPALAQTNVSITVGQPNFYGRIDLGDFGPPPVVYAQPVVIERQVRYVEQPVYLRVPEGHRKHWSKHCRAYGACGQQVYFVQDGWYSNTYAPRYREQQRQVVVVRDRGDYRREDDRDRRGRDREHDHDDERGHGHGHDRGHRDD
jgi:hypothetical protein